MLALEIKDVNQAFGPKKVLYNVNLEVNCGEFVSLVGPSGCGKSTLLRAILGTHPPMHGEITAGTEKVTKPNRNVGIVYQHYSLYEFMNAEKNVAFGLHQDQTSILFRWFGYFFGWKEIKKRNIQKAKDMLISVGLEKAIQLYPGEMSGGMRQRVAIAQALIMQPKILLLDEPFGALDEATREELQDMLVALYKENKRAIADGLPAPYTIIIVTHELNEAIYLSDRVVGLSQYHKNGKEGATIVYDEPSTAFDRNSERDYSLFIRQKEELRNIVFNPS